MALLGTSALVVFIGMAFYGTRWEEIDHCLTHNIGGVATIVYLPYTVFCYVSPLMSILAAVCIGAKCRR